MSATPSIPTKKILNLLNAGHPPDVRGAAALVLGELGVRGADVGAALCACLDDPDAAVRLRVIRAVGRLRVADALPQLLDRVHSGGEEAHAAAEAAAHLGAKGRKGLQDLMPRVAPGVRRIIAAALAAEGAVAQEDSALAVLLDKERAVVEGATQSLIEQIPTLHADQRDALEEQLTQWLTAKHAALPPASEPAMMRLLAALGDARAAPLFWERILPPTRPEVRALALQKLGEWVETPTKEQFNRLLTCAAERDFRVAAPALMILKKLPVNEKLLPEWSRLLDAPDVMSRQLALEKVGGFDTDEVAAGLLRQIQHPDRALREGALTCLGKLTAGRKALLAALLEAHTADHAWTLARAQAALAGDHAAGWRDPVFARAQEYLEADDRRADPLLFLLRETDAHDLRDRLEERALHWRKQGDYQRALHYLRLLGRDPACGFALRFEQAACGLKASAQDLAADSRNADPCLAQFVRLCQQDDAAVLTELEKSKWLEPADLFYLGFHLAEQEGRPKKCAAEVLKLVAKRSPRSKLAQAAKSKLKSSGLD